MNPNACLKSLNSNTRCRFPFTTLQPSSLRSPAAISCFDSFPLLMCPPVPRQLQFNRFFTRHSASHFGSSSALRLYFRREAITRKNGQFRSVSRTQELDTSDSQGSDGEGTSPESASDSLLASFL